MAAEAYLAEDLGSRDDLEGNCLATLFGCPTVRDDCDNVEVRREILRGYYNVFDVPFPSLASSFAPILNFWISLPALLMTPFTTKLVGAFELFLRNTFGIVGFVR